MGIAIKVRKAAKTDAKEIWHLIHELAIYERAEEEHTVNAAQLEEDMAAEKFIAFVAEVEHEIVGMALCYPIYSTWKGESLYLEDIVVKENFRRHGIGSKLFFGVMQYAKNSGAGRLGWQVLNWNEPAIAFYEKYNAELDDEWINCKLTRDQLQMNNKSPAY